jgi:hypothetical protein
LNLTAGQAIVFRFSGLRHSQGGASIALAGDHR